MSGPAPRELPARYVGTPGEAPLLLVHGLGSCWEHWSPMLELLGKAPLETCAVDLPGFGDAPPLDGPPTLGRLADALEAHLDAAGWPTAHLAGNSLGGLLSLELARRGRARSVTAFSPAGMATGLDDLRSRLMLRAQHAAGRRLRSALPGLASRAAGRIALLGGAAAHPARVASWLAERLAVAYVDSDAVLPTLDAFDASAIVTDLARVEAPVTIAWGDRDVLLPPRQGLAYAEAMPRARLVRLRGLGHSPMTDDPDLCAEVVLRTAGVWRG